MICARGSMDFIAKQRHKFGCMQLRWSEIQCSQCEIFNYLKSELLILHCTFSKWVNDFTKSTYCTVRYSEPKYTFSKCRCPNIIWGLRRVLKFKTLAVTRLCVIHTSIALVVTRIWTQMWAYLLETAVPSSTKGTRIQSTGASLLLRYVGGENFKTRRCIVSILCISIWVTDLAKSIHSIMRVT